MSQGPTPLGRRPTAPRAGPRGSLRQLARRFALPLRQGCRYRADQQRRNPCRRRRLCRSSHPTGRPRARGCIAWKGDAADLRLSFHRFQEIDHSGIVESDRADHQVDLRYVGQHALHHDPCLRLCCNQYSIAHSRRPLQPLALCIPYTPAMGPLRALCGAAGSDRRSETRFICRPILRNTSSTAAVEASIRSTSYTPDTSWPAVGPMSSQ